MKNKCRVIDKTHGEMQGSSFETTEINPKVS